MEFKYLTMQKKQIREGVPDEAQSSTTQTTSSSTNAGAAMNLKDSDVDSTSSFPLMESIDENIITENSFCILVGATLRQHAVTPKNVNIKEYEMMLSSYKALFKVIKGDNKGAMECYNKADQSRKNIGQDAAQITQQIVKPAS